MPAGPQGGTSPDQIPDWFKQYQEQFVGQIGQAFDRIQAANGQQIAELAQKVEGGKPPPAPQIPANADEILAQQLLTQPTRTIAELNQIIRSQAQADARAIVEQHKQELQAQNFAGRFWQEFYHYNPDLRAHDALVQGLFPMYAAQSPNDWSNAANNAADYIRKTLAQERANAEEATRRQRAQAQATSTGAGVQQLAAMLNPNARGGAAEEEIDRDDDGRSYIDELEQAREKRLQRNWGRAKVA